MSHVNDHQTGQVVGFVEPGSVFELGYIPCSHCSRFYKTNGLKTHMNRCAQKHVLAAPLAHLSGDDVDDDPFLISLREVATVPIPTLTFVPAPHRQAWGRVLAVALHNAASLNTVEAWVALLMLPKCVLSTPKRGGTRNRGDNHTVTDLCVAWEKGHKKWLWTRALRPVRQSASLVDPKRVLSAAVQHARQGRLGKACSTLSSSGLAPSSDATVTKLRQKHPQTDPPIAVDAADDAVPALQLDNDFNLLGALTSFAKDVGTDGTNFRVQHLLDGTEAHLSTSVLNRLRKLINLLLSGRVNPDVQPFLAGARLTALAKGEGDIRPIAAGNVFRRLASKCACALLQKRASAELGPLQVGVACRGGAEQIVHTMRHTLDLHWNTAGFTLLKVDFSNAFNAISRDALLRECQERFPDLLPWAKWCYGSQALLFYGDSIEIKSCVGVQQGDPLGPLLFCLVLHVLVRKIHLACPHLDLERWYLDDGVLAGSAADVATALAIIRQDGPALGLHLNLKKCELFSALVANFGVSVVNPVLGQIDFPAELSQRSTTPNLVLLGSPFGDAQYCVAHVENLQQSSKKLLDCFPKLGDPQVALHLLRTCAGFSKFVYVARTTPPQLIGDALLACDVDVRACFDALAVLQLSNAAWLQAQLALSLGGLGLRSTGRHCTATYIASHTAAMPGQLTAGLQAALHMHNACLGNAGPLDANLVDSWLAVAPSQGSLSLKIEKLDQKKLATLANTLVDRIRLDSVAAAHSSAWLQAMPSKGPFDLTLEPNEMQVALQHRLGLPLAAPTDTCPLCSNHSLLDASGHHQLTCHHKGSVTSRHNRLRDVLHGLCNHAGMHAQVEQGASHGDQTRPADLLVPAWSLGKSAAFDLTVVSPHTIVNINNAGSIDVVKAAAEKKHAENDAKCDVLGWLCVPLAVDVYGRWCDEAHDSYSKIATHLKTRAGGSMSAALRAIYNTLGVWLARHNARAILARRSNPQLGAHEVRQLSGPGQF